MGSERASLSGPGSGRNTPLLRLDDQSAPHNTEEDHNNNNMGTGSITPLEEGMIPGAATSTSAHMNFNPIMRRRKRSWHEPKMNEFANLTAYDAPQAVVERLAKKAKLHWDMRDSVKEGETLTNFIFALRMRGTYR
jgi:hypothetical protein